MPFSRKLHPDEAVRLDAWLSSRPWAERIERPWVDFAYRVRGESLAWLYYPGKKALVEQGKAGPAGEQARAEMMAAFPVLAEEARQVSVGVFPHSGGDESGKGDTFGPLAVAAVRVEDAAGEQTLRELGVRDSKTLSDKQIRERARRIREHASITSALRCLEPEAYNAAFLAQRMAGGNLNRLLARLHGECTAELLAGGPLALVVIDRFTDDTVLGADLPSGVPFRAEPKAERYAAVAAASILARDACLDWFESEAAQGRRWPRGSSAPEIPTLLRWTYRAGGTTALGRAAKLHFSSVQAVLFEEDEG